MLAGGNGIGGNANASVFATLICEAAPTFVERNTDVAGVPLAPNGDFKIDDILSPAPNGCASPVLLIRNAGNRTWFAAGMPKLEDERSRPRSGAARLIEISSASCGAPCARCPRRSSAGSPR